MLSGDVDFSVKSTVRVSGIALLEGLNCFGSSVSSSWLNSFSEDDDEVVEE